MKNYRLKLIPVLVLSIICFQSLSAFDGEGYNISSNTFIRNWLVAGPFPNPRNMDPAEGESWTRGFDHDFLGSLGGESNAVLSPGQTMEFRDLNNEGKSVEVFPASTNEAGVLEFDGLFPDQDFKAAYVYTEIYSDESQTCAFYLGSDDGVKVWLNGELIHENDVGRALSPRQDYFTGELNKGSNRLLVKVTDMVRNWALIVEAFDSGGYKKLLQEKRDREDFYDLLITGFSAPRHLENYNSFYAGDSFPKLKWDKPYLIEKVAGKVDMSFRWFNSKLKEVTAPDKPGMYAYYAEGTSEKGYKIRRASTLYAFPWDWQGWGESTRAYLDFQPVSTLNKKDWINNEDVIARYVGRMFNYSSIRAGDASILISFVDSQQPGDEPGELNTPIIKDGDYHVALKRKILGVENKWTEFKLPAEVNENSTVIHKGTEEEAGVKAGTGDAIRKVCRQWFEESKEPFDILIARNGVIIIHEAFGEDVYGKFTTETPTEIASVTKMLTGLIFGQFVEQGLINIDSYVGEYLPDFEINTDTSITLRHCFTHTAGLFGHTTWGGVQNSWQDNSVAALLPTLTVNKVHQYNGVGYNLAGKVMEIVSGKSMFRLFRECLFDPLGMDNTYNEEDLAYGTQSTAYDLALVGQMVLNGGVYGNTRFFSKSTLESLFPKPLNQWYPEINQDWGIGMTWMRQYRSNDGDDSGNNLILGKNVVGHGSATATILRIDLDNDLIIAQSRRRGGQHYEKYLEKLYLVLEENLKN
jgi:CubicO group peptidase (beta-lactamase class C family)